MNLRRFLIEAATLVIAAVILGLVANAIAGSEKRVGLASPEPFARANERPATSPAPTSSIIEDGMANEPSTSASGMEEAGPAQEQPSASSASKASREEILARFPASPEVPAEEIHTDDAEWLWRNGVLFLDARRTAAYNEGHIPGARNFAVWEADVDDKVKALATEGLDADMPVVIYCSGGECEDSHMLAQKLWGMFFNNLRVYHEGYPGWTAEGNPAKKGANP